MLAKSIPDGLFWMVCYLGHISLNFILLCTPSHSSKYSSFDQWGKKISFFLPSIH